jgi:hypothetical protein
MRKIMWGFREREPLKSVVIHGVGYTCLICEHLKGSRMREDRMGEPEVC